MSKNLDDDSDGPPVKTGYGHPPPGRLYIEPPTAFARALEPVFKVYERGSTYRQEIRAGCVLFMSSAYILFLNPLILSGGSSAFDTGMPKSDIALATALSTGIATLFMAFAGNFPWVVSVQLGTNTYFVNSVLQLNEPCGHHAHYYGAGACAGLPCSCALFNGTMLPISANDPTSECFGTANTCEGTKIPFEQGLAATFLEGVVFAAICLLGLREYLIRCLPKSVLMAGAAGIGVFISFTGLKSMEVIVAAPYPTLVALNENWPYSFSGWGSIAESGIGYNSCQMFFNGPPYSVICPWLSTGGLIFTGLLLVWDVHGALIIGIFFTTFIAWAKFPGRISASVNPGLVPDKFAEVPKFTTTNGALDFNWGSDTAHLVQALVTFLYLDFIGSCITFVAMGQMMGIIDDHGRMPRANMAFLSDAMGAMLGGLLGSSALTTYVESASAVKEGGRTGFTAVVCALFFFSSVFFAPTFAYIPDIATGPILVLIGVLIFMSSIMDIDWLDITEALPAYACILGMPFTSNIAYGVIGGMIVYVVIKFGTYQLFPFQKNWPGVQVYKRMTSDSKDMFMRIPGWNCEWGLDGPHLPHEPWYFDLSLASFIKRVILPKFGYPYTTSVNPKAYGGDDSAHAQKYVEPKVLPEASA